MRSGAIASLCFTLAAGPLAARDIVLNPPIACDLQSDCYIQQYVDHDPSDNAMDFRCAPLTYDTHKGTDFALRSLAQMEAGVDVIPAAPGTVRATRDGMADQVYTPALAAQIDGRECGNGLVIDHGGGWSTQYCHLKRGSIKVAKGDRVDLTKVLGQVGLSGRTQFPHVHMTLRKDNNVIDPFDPDGQITCGAPSTDTLWQDPPPYRPGGILRVGFADAVPEFATIKAGKAHADILTAKAPALVVFAYIFGGRAGDKVTLRIDGPDGVFMDETVTLEKDQAQLFRAVGKRHRADWTSGAYSGTASLIRDDTVISTEQGTLRIP
ncbi:MAG: M23 family metallopeptidase [Pseudomonadota bacterium]